MSGDAQLISADATHRLLSALGEQLGLLGERYELVVIGGSALLARGLVSRPTRDVDVVALVDSAGFMSAEPLPGPLAEACARVARDFDLPTDWVNSEPAGMLRLGLPQGFAERLDRREYGPYLAVRYASRLDQIHFKLYALADRGGGGKHEADLRALVPTRDELIAAARWSRTHDPSEGYRDILIDALTYLGVKNADVGP
jgi:hypothetical protein